ncbi:hypothetical protein SAMN05216203_1383 [Marinobacter daqiaonensis]|uniref:Inner membrane protein n=1 Tax=Marinobacter daqiaonensis TaxID=650891 RepID=A0A1I6HNS1_9GAMM|nr:YbaN family protein [Marinobacter daqiaonensis]SFR56092.1 hypothetical protein SAMN05216203_1383 [Marinobacter daqiaonensis]
MSRTVYRILAYCSLGLGVAGIALPLLPTTPFVLLAAWLASRSSPAFNEWLLGHRTFGPIIENWRERRAVPMRAKLAAAVLLTSSWTMLLMLGSPPILLVVAGVFFSGLLLFLMTRPTG